ncbi:MAG: O-antigen ligase family protein [Terricaulis sp.]
MEQSAAEKPKGAPLAGWGAGLFMALLPASASGGGLALAPFLGLTAALAIRPAALKRALGQVFVWTLLAFLGWAILSTAWTSYSDHGQAIRLAFTALPGLIFVAGTSADERTRRFARAAGVAAVIVLLAMLALEALADMPLNRANQPDADTERLVRNPGRGVTVLVTLIWGALGALMLRGGVWRYALCGALLIGAGLLSTQFDMSANLLGLVFGFAMFSLALATPRVTIGLVIGGLTLWLLAAPFIAPLLSRDPALVALLPDSWAVRVEIWKFAAHEIMENPLLGYGLDASRAYTDTIVVRGQTVSALPLHPHSASLQIWLETGVVGALLAAAALITGAIALIRALGTQRIAAAAACGALGSIGLIANVSYGAWQEWWVATALAAAALVAAVRHEDTP